jgi:glucosamine-6-phosphate deaminase
MRLPESSPIVRFTVDSLLSVVVSGPRKAEAVLATLPGPIGESCPATALRRHPCGTLHLDRDSARLVL